MKNVIICLDGTGNQYCDANTNIIKFYSLLDDSQVTYYEPGVGTLDGTIGFVTGWHVNDKVGKAYSFIMRNYEKGDKIFITGFSRGAFTARALAGLIGEYGIPKRGLDDLIPYVLKDYFGKGTYRDGYRKTFAVDGSDLSVIAIGVYDTVKSVMNSDRYDIDCTKAQFRFQAMAMDEKRSMFKLVRFPYGTANEVWFEGAHSDIGGGYKNGEDRADVTLLWMINRFKEVGLKVNQERVDKEVHPNLMANTHDSYMFPAKLLGSAKRKFLQDDKFFEIITKIE